MDVQQIMTPDPEYLAPTATLRDAAYMMKGLDVGSVPVINEGRLIGIVTDRDIVIRGLAGNRSFESQISEVMSKDVSTISPGDDVEKAYKLMEDEQIRRLPVVDDSGKLVGMVSLGDLATRAEDPDKAGEALEEISERN